jgi:hypothetical protein
MTLNARAYVPKTKASFRPINPAVLAERRRLKCWIRATKHASDQRLRDIQIWQICHKTFGRLGRPFALPSHSGRLD